MSNVPESTWIQAKVGSALISMGWEHEPDDVPGGVEEYGLSLKNSLRLRRHPVYLKSDGSASFHSSQEEEGRDKTESTLIQTRISPVFEKLGFVLHPSGCCGGDMKYTLPPAAARALRRHNIVVQSDGSVDFIREDLE